MVALWEASRAAPEIIALHGDFASARMLMRDVGDLAESIDVFWDANGWRRTEPSIAKLERHIRTLSTPPILIGYSRGGSVIAALSERVELRAAIVYESPVIDSDGVGGAFPVLMCWNDCGVMAGKRKGQAKIAQQIWKASHPVTEIWGKGRHVKFGPIGHGWDCGLNGAIRDFLEACG
jgi:pimeloyl-ACP methyl ester carboxylesterase